jgi:hypothetical protein
VIAAAFPGFLVAAGVLAAIPVALHFLARRPPARTALPTARFLTEDPRTLLRFQRKPMDAALLAVRLAFALALGAAFAGLGWKPERSGAVRLVLVDAGADPAVAWADAADAVRAVDGVAPGGGSEDGAGGGTEAALVLAYGLDEGARVVDSADLEGIERGARPATAEEGLRALREAAAEGGFAQAAVTWVGRPSWHAWSPGLGLMRSQLWPGRMELRLIPVDAAGPVSAEAAADAETTPVAWLVDGAEGDALQRAIEALGGRVVRTAWTADWIFATDVDATSLLPLMDHVRRGSTLVVSGRMSGDVADLPWVVDERTSGAAHLVLPGDRGVGTPVDRLPGAPAAGARTVAIFDDATPAAAARSLADGCVVYLAADLTAPGLTTAADYPNLVRALARGCGASGSAEGPLDPPLDSPLDRGALRVLEGPDLPGTVDVASLVAAEGIPLTRWLVLLALALLGLEVAMTRERRA